MFCKTPTSDEQTHRSIGIGFFSCIGIVKRISQVLVLVLLRQACRFAVDTATQGLIFSEKLSFRKILEFLAKFLEFFGENSLYDVIVTT